MKFWNVTCLFILSPFFFQNQGISQTLNNQNLDSHYSVVKYRNIGPFRGGRSVTASGVIGDPLTYYMGTTGGGLWKTDDAGQLWHNISDGYFKTGSVGAVSVSESDPNVVYCGMGEHAPRGVMTSHGDGVYKSTDAGKTWTKLGLEKTQHISRIIIHPSNPDIVYVAAQGALHKGSQERGIYKSTDGGQTWKNTLFVNSLTGCSELSIDHSNPNVLYAAMWEHQRMPWKIVSGGEGSGLYKSTDAGETWNKIHNGLPKEKGKMAIAVSRANPEKVYALVESDTNKDKSGLFVSNNAGDSWTRVSTDNRLTQRAWYYIEVFPDPNNENTVYVLSAPALRSIDGGKTWERITGTHGDYHDLWINPNNSKNMVIANDGGAAISFNNAKTWSTQSTMPIGQFYRVNVDNQFPYNIYGGQQDYPSLVIASRELGSAGISSKSWANSAGGESAFLAFDPDNPRYVMGGSYLGTIELLDTKSGAGTKIMSSPIQYLGMEAREMKYLYNWNAPIIWSQHEEDTYYHGAQYLLRTRDKGNSWEEISDDLTRNQDDKQGNGGGPYTNEAVGAENYGTLSYVIESPHEKGVIWTGSDDGLVHITRDGGDSWTNVTPSGLPECLINAIDVSPHDPATAYMAATRYKFDDKRPGLYKTSNYGKTWTEIHNGIPDGSFTRVIREDTSKKGLLFVGTETGMFMSDDDGKNWKPLQLNLPVTPILDLKIRHDDLIIATSGRSFWILDDLGLFRQGINSEHSFHMYQPEDTYQVSAYSELDRTSKSFDGTHPTRGVNPATGVVIYYHIENVDSSELTIMIHDENGDFVNSYSTEADKSHKSYAGGPPSKSTISNKKGLNRFVWNMRYPTMPGIPTAYIEGSYRGHKAKPGRYTVSLKQGEKLSSSEFTIKQNPLYPTDINYTEYHNTMSEMEATLTEMHDMTNRLNSKRDQIKSVMDNIKDAEKKSLIQTQVEELSKALQSWDEEMVQRKSLAYDDVENFPNKFTANYLFLINSAESDIPRINEATKNRKKELDAEWQRLKSIGDDLEKNKIPAINQLLWEQGIGAVN